MKFLMFKHEKHYLSAEQAQNILKYGFKNVTLQEAFTREVDELETAIKSKSASGIRIITTTFQDYKMDLAEKLAEHFKEKGFTTDIYENPEIKGFIILILGW